MKSTPPNHPDEPAERLPPPQPMPPAPDLHLQGTPLDPLGAPDRPREARPIQSDERTTRIGQLAFIAFIIVVVLGFALLVWMVS